MQVVYKAQSVELVMLLANLKIGKSLKVTAFPTLSVFFFPSFLSFFASNTPTFVTGGSVK